MMKSNLPPIACALALSSIVAARICMHFDLVKVPPNLIQSIEKNEFVPTLIKYFILCIPLFLLWKRYKYCQQFSHLPGMGVRFGVIGDLKTFYQTFKRIRCPGLTSSELTSSLWYIMQSFEPQYRGIYAFWMGPQPIVTVTSPQLIGEILSGHGDLKKGQHYDFLEWAMGTGLITSTGKKWSHTRKLLTPTFHFKVLESVMPNILYNQKVLLERLEREASSNPDRQIGDIAKYIFPCTLDILCQSSMGVDTQAQKEPDSQFCKSFHELQNSMMEASFNPLLKVFWYKLLRPLTNYGRKVDKQLQTFNQLPDEAIKNRLAVVSTADVNSNCHLKQNTKEPFLDTLLREHMDRPHSFTLTDVRDEVNTFMSAGHDTTGWTLVYTLFLIGHYPEVQTRIHEELDAFFASYTNESDITIDSLKELKYTEAVVKESMRLYPPVPMVARKVEKNLKIGKWTIPAGAELAISISLAHRDPEHWDDPVRFNPERFLNNKAPHPYAFIPFSAGPRNCLGQRYAMTEIKSLVAFVLNRYTIKSLDSIDSVLTYGLPVSQTKTPLRMKLIPRDNN